MGDIIPQAVKFFLLLACISGYYFYIEGRQHGKREGVRLQPAFCFPVVVSAIGVLMFLGGLANLLNQMALLIFCGGLICLLISVRKGYVIRKQDLVLYIWFAGALILFAVSQKASIYAWDNFSHWALVVKQMLLTGRFPDARDTMILFQAYPTGSAGFIYFICRFLGNSESTMLFGQYLLTFSVAAAMYGAVKERCPEGYVAVTAGIVFLFLYNTRVNGLMVDNLLSALGIAGVWMIYTYRKEIGTGVIYGLFPAAFLPMVKNSGLFFAAMMWGAAMVFAKGREKAKTLPLLAVPLGVLWIWKKHTAAAFPSPEQTMHSMSLSYMENIFSEKSGTAVREITRAFLGRMAHPLENGTWFLLLLCLLLFLWTIREKTGVAGTARVMAFGVFWGLIYQGLLLGTYIFSMSGDEAKELASYERYHKTMLLVLMGLLLCYALTLVRKENLRRAERAAGCLAGIALAALGLRYSVQKDTVETMRLEKQQHQQLKNLEAEQGVNPGKAYIVYTNKPNNGYLHFLCRYEFLSDRVSLVDEGSVGRFQDWKEYDYLLVLDKKVPEKTRKFLVRQAEKEKIRIVPKKIQ